MDTTLAKHEEIENIRSMELPLKCLPLTLLLLSPSNYILRYCSYQQNRYSFATTQDRRG